MDAVLARLLGFVLRVVLLMAGLVVFISLLAAALLLAALWGLRALWARITGKPVMPWVMGVDPRAAWRTAAGRSWERGRQQRGEPDDQPHEPPMPPQAGAAGPLLRPLPGTEEVTDVKSRPSAGATESHS